MNNALHIIGDITHEIQRERGTACLHVGLGEDTFKQKLINQFQQTDTAVDQGNQAFEKWNIDQSLPPETLAKLKNQLERLTEWASSRTAIVEHQLPAADIINIYTDQLVSPLINLVVEIAFLDPNNHPTRVTAYSNFLHWKESTGRERALGLRGFAKGNFTEKDYTDWLKFQIAEQQSSKDLFLTLADQQQKQCLELLLKSPAWQQVENINDALMGTIDRAFLSTLNAIDWFKLASKKIDLMREVEIRLVNILYKDQAVTQKQHIEMVTTDNNFNSSITHHDQQFLGKLPLFSDLPESVYKELLKHVQIDTHSKGKLLFMENEQASRLYVILHGWVKLSKSNQSGEEATLQMLTSGDTLAESSVFLNVPLPESAQVIEPARILTLPAPILRKLVRDSNQLAVNMLASMSRISRNFMRQIESTRLKTADERVGWFFLKLMLEQNRFSHDYVDLPFDKAIVASYLNMKPETLSRTLKRFREFGFEVARDRIRLPEPSALCNFCDAHLAANCDHENTDFCILPKS